MRAPAEARRSPPPVASGPMRVFASAGKPTKYSRRWYVGTTPEFFRPVLNWLQPEFEPMSREDLVQEMNARLQLPGWTNAFTQPIRNHVDMLSTGIRAPFGIGVYVTAA